jgi:hypothetical protein
MRFLVKQGMTGKAKETSIVFEKLFLLFPKIDYLLLKK